MNRKSVSSKDSRPPQRFKNNGGENNSSSQIASESSGRASRPRSMLPQVSSGANKRSSSQTGIPCPGAKKAPGPTTASQRSRSIGVPMMEKNSNRLMTTPGNSQGSRASSGTRESSGTAGTAARRQSCITPQRYLGSQSSRKSLLYSTGKITSTGTKMGHSGRDSAIGAAKCLDTRPLAEKSYQQSQVKQILDFLRKHKFENSALTSKHFPLSSKEFVNVFNFIYSFLQGPKENSSDIQVIPYQRFEENVIPILKSLKYPGKLTRANFLSLGSMHSWPAALGSLSYLCNLANIYTEKLCPNITEIGFLNLDDQGFPVDKESDEKITFVFYTECFNEFNGGADEFPAQTKKYEASMMENNGINIEHLKILQKKEFELRTQLTQLENTPSNLKVLLEQCQNFEQDKVKLLTYSNSMESHISKITKDKELQLKIVQDLTLKLTNLDGDVKKLREIRLSGEVSSGSLDDEDSTKAEELRRQVEQAKKDTEEIDKEVFKQEIQVSKARQGLEAIAKQFNSVSVEEGVGGQDPLLLSVPVFRGGELVEEKDNESYRSQLSDFLKSGRATTRNAERELQAEVAKVEQLEDVCRQRKSEEAQKKKGVKNQQEEIADFQETIEKEDAALDAQISFLKETLHTIQSQEVVDIPNKSRQLRILEEKVAETKLLQQSKHEENLDFLAKSIAKAKAYIKDCENYRDAAAKSVVEKSHDVVNGIRESMAAINIRVNAVVENVEKNI